MILYHGGTDIIRSPLCNNSRENLDFDKGFYLTSMITQAKTLAKRQARDRNGEPIVNVYDFDRASALSLGKYLYFPENDKGWLDFVIASRSGKKPWSEYDIIEGGSVNDCVIDTIRLYIYGFSTKEDTLKRLSEFRPDHQICVLSQDIIDNFLKFKEYIVL